MFCLLLCPSSTLLFFCFAHHSLFPSATRHTLFVILLPLLFSSFKICYCCLLKQHTHRFPFKADHFFLSKLHFLELSCNYLLLCIYTCFCKFKNSCAFIVFFAPPVVRKFFTERSEIPFFFAIILVQDLSTSVGDWSCFYTKNTVLPCSPFKLGQTLLLCSQINLFNFLVLQVSNSSLRMFPLK